MLTLTKSYFSEIKSVNNNNNRDTKENSQTFSTPATGSVRKAIIAGVAIAAVSRHPHKLSLSVRIHNNNEQLSHN